MIIKHFYYYVRENNDDGIDNENGCDRRYIRNVFSLLIIEFSITCMSLFDSD